MIRAVIFDMDGVVVDSERHWFAKEFEMIRMLVPAWSSTNQRELTGMSLIDIYNRLQKEAGIPLCEKDFIAAYDSLAKDIYEREVSLYPGVFSILSRLKKSGLRVGLCSSSKKSWIDVVLKRFCIGSFFDSVVCSEDVQNHAKPNPDIYLKMISQLGVKNEECLAIEDSENGIISARAAGIYCVGFDNGFNKKKDLRMADCIMTDFLELEFMLKSELID